MCCSGYNPEISYCPNCGNNKNYDNKNWVYLNVLVDGKVNRLNF